jgi:hypothetical protein
MENDGKSYRILVKLLGSFWRILAKGKRISSVAIKIRRRAACTRTAYCVTFLPHQPLKQQNTHLTNPSQILTELSTGMKSFGGENCARFEFRELVIIRKLTLYNVVRQASRGMSGQYLQRRMTRDYISQGPSL